MIENESEEQSIDEFRESAENGSRGSKRSKEERKSGGLDALVWDRKKKNRKRPSSVASPSPYATHQFSKSLGRMPKTMHAKEKNSYTTVSISQIKPVLEDENR